MTKFRLWLVTKEIYGPHFLGMDGSASFSAMASLISSKQHSTQGFEAQEEGISVLKESYFSSQDMLQILSIKR